MEKITREEALAKVAEVLEEALAEYEALEKMETTEGAALAKADAPPFVQAKKEDDQDEEAPEADEADEAADDSDEEEENDEDKDKEEAPADEEAAPADDESDDELKAMKKAIDAKLEKRGLLKSESKTEAKELKKSETAPAAPADDLRKSVDERFETLTKTLTSLAETVSKIAAQPAQSRKGVAGYAPLKKNEEGSTEGQPLNKAQALEKLLDLKKSGDKRVSTALINRLETGRMSQQEFETIKGLLA